MANKLMNQTDIEDVRQVLRKFQEGYTNRNVDALDDYLKELFIDSDKMITVGTNRSEWCFGLKGLRGILESDWKYWGNLHVDVESAKINSKDDTAWFVADCQMQWSEEETFDEWCAIILSDYYGKEGRYIGYKTESKLAMMNVKLTLLMKIASIGISNDLPTPIRISGGLVREDNTWHINRLHFSIPMPSYPEWRIDPDNPDAIKYFEQAKENMLKHQKSFNTDSRSSICQLLTGFQSCYLDSESSTNLVVNDMFLPYDDIYVVDPSEVPAAIGKGPIGEMIKIQRDKWDSMTLNIDESIIGVEGDTAFIITNGIFKKNTPTEEFLEKEWERVKATIQKEGNGTDKLFEAQKQIANTFKELSFGEEALWEFRFEALAVKEDGKWKFHNVHFTYPALYVFETNYSMTPML